MRFAAAALILLTMTSSAFGQESLIAGAKDNVRQNPASADASIALGRALRRAGKEADALTELRRALGFAQRDQAVSVTWEIARTHIAKRDFAAAMNACNTLVKNKDGAPMTNPPPTANALATNRVCAAEAHLLWRRGTEAMGEIIELAKLKDVNAEVRYFWKVAEARTRDLDSKETEAEAAFKEAIQLAPNKPDAHLFLGTMLLHAGKDGVPALKKAVELDPKDPTANLELGRALSQNAATRNDALAAFERAAAERPSFLEALRGQTEIYIAQNKLTDAKRIAANVLKIAPNDVLSHIVSGRVALADGKPDDAIKEGEIALKLQPNAGAAKLLVADAYTKKGEIDLALEAYQKASGLDPLDPTPLINATYACLTHNRVTSAKAFGQRAVLDFPKVPAAWVAQGDAFVADGNPKAARTAFENAKKLNGADVAAIDAKLAKLK